MEDCAAFSASRTLEPANIGSDGFQFRNVSRNPVRSLPKALQSVGLLVDLHPHVREPALAIGDLSHQLVPARLGIAHERVGARLRVRDDARRFFLGRLHDRPIDRAAHLVDIGGLVGVDPHRTGLVPQLDLGSIAHAFFQIVPQLPVHGLVERARAHLLIVEAPISIGVNGTCI